jgi:hypothetical protein
VRGQRQDRARGCLIVEIAPLDERRFRCVEQAAIERRDAQISGAASRVSEAADRAQRIPNS